MIMSGSAALVAAVVMAVAGCSATGGSNDAGSDGDAGLVRPPLACLDPGAGPYALEFEDVTDELGLGAAGLAVAGNGAVVTDLDGDHWPDLAVTRATSAADTLGPDPRPYRLLRNLGGSFQDITYPSRLFGDPAADMRASTFVVFGDFDGDGDQDAFSAVYQDAANRGTVPNASAVLLNDGYARFTPVEGQSFQVADDAPVVSVVTLDFDRDGVLDLFLAHHYGRYGYLNTAVQDALFRGSGSGTFTDVTQAAGLVTLAPNTVTLAAGTNHRPSWGASACDLDGDGWPEILVSAYGRQFNLLWHNQGGTFAEIGQAAGFAADGNDDYSDNQFFLCWCQARPGEAVCQGAAQPLIDCSGLENAWQPGFDDQPFRLGGNSSNTLCGDIDGDGDMDLVQVELAHWHIGNSSDRTELLRNQGFPEEPFSRPGNAASGLSREHGRIDWNEGDLGGALCDFDNDGRLDVLVASSDYPDTYSLLWQQQADGQFLEVSGAAGVQLPRAHGVAVLDYDRDGDYDLLLGTSLMRWSSGDEPPRPADAYVHLLRNTGGQDANRIMVHLEGAGPPGGANRDAVGARVVVELDDRVITRELQGAHGLQGLQHDRLLIIGIGAACAARRLSVTWPDAAGSSVSYADIPANYVVMLRQGQLPEFLTLEQYARR